MEELEHYEQGLREQVWTDLLALGDLRGLSGAQLEQAAAVASETMSRVRRNVEYLAEALPREGYVFVDPERVLVAPPADVEEQIAAVEHDLGGPMPLSLRCFYRLVGSIDLRGHNPAWGFDYGDPLVVSAPLDYVLPWLAEWRADPDPAPRTFALDLGPDFLRKAHGEGAGGHYFMQLPNPAIDGLLLGEITQTTLVGYLRLAFRHGGFPGWARTAPPHWACPPVPLPEPLERLSAQLLPV